MLPGARIEVAAPRAGAVLAVRTAVVAWRLAVMRTAVAVAVMTARGRRAGVRRMVRMRWCA